MNSNNPPDKPSRGNPLIERVVLENTTPSMLMHHRVLVHMKNSKIIKDVAYLVAQTEGDEFVANHSAFTKANGQLVRQRMFVAFTNESKKTTPEVVRAAVMVNSLLDAARCEGYAVGDGVFNDAMAVIRKNLDAGVISEAIAKRRAKVIEDARDKNEDFANTIIEAAKTAVQDLGTEAVSRVRRMGAIDAE